MNPHFRLFGLPEQFDLDSEALQQTYRRLAAQLHPDKTATASAFEQKQAVMMAAAVNEAYRLLADPLHRAALLLQQQGIEADAPEHTAFAPEFLMRQMEWREALADARAAQDQHALQALADTIGAEETALHRQLAQDFQTQAYQQAADHVRQGRFLAKLRQEIRDAQAV